MSKMSGFSTLNRWLGKKNKDKNMPNGKLSKSNTNLNLSVSTVDMSEPSQLEYNRITPVPVATSNAPFEQTFRITVLLPKDQLYVARLGARITLSKLLELVCEHKLLDAQKYEFRNPVDASQVYSNELTIGAVGLSEVRLCHKSESYDNFNADEVIKLHRTSVIRDSLSSSEFSSRNSKHTTKTASPYSSSNSLNSMDSAGVNYTRTPITGPPPTMPATTPPKMTAPPRKKRAAPRPPSQTMIPEKSALVLPKGADDDDKSSPPRESNNLPRKDYYVSTPNLATMPATQQSPPIDCNGNSHSDVATTNGHSEEHDSHAVEAQVDQKNARNLYGGSVQNLSTTQAQINPEPSPRKRLLHIKKKSAPAPPPGQRYSMYSEDSVSLASNSSFPSTPQTPQTPQTPDLMQRSAQVTAVDTPTKTADGGTVVESPPPVKPMPREHIAKTAQQPLQASTPMEHNEPVAQASPAPSMQEAASTSQQQQVPRPVPRSTTTTLLNATPQVAAAIAVDEAPIVSHSHSAASSPTTPAHNNVSKVILNRTPTPEPRSLSTEPPLDIMLDSGLGSRDTSSHLNELTGDHDNDDNVSKQADSGIGEPVPSPLPDSLPSEGSANECKSTFESSSDDDDIKVYNFKLGKTLTKPLRDSETLNDLSAITAAQSDSGENTPATQADEAATPMNTETTSWNFAIPISPPPNFADSRKMADAPQEDTSDTPITPKIMERPMLNFDALTAESKSVSPEPKLEKPKPVALAIPVRAEQHVRSTTPLPSPTGPLNEILDELTTIIAEKRVDTLIKKVDQQPQIEAAKPNTLSNFSITASELTTTKPLEIQNNNDNTGSSATPPTTPEDERIYRKRGSLTNNNNGLPTRRSISRSDSFHTTVTQQLQSISNIANGELSNGGIASRSSSYLSLAKSETSGNNLNCRRSSSELSIGESPSLQSLEVIKTILNSRKNSLANSSDGETKTTTTTIFTEVVTTKSAAQPVEVGPERRRAIESPFTVQPKSRDNSEEETAENPATEKRADAHEQVARELPKIYRYSGPPSINFSTWSERPKVQVAIKNEGDYIFGGKKAAATTTPYTLPMASTASSPGAAAPTTSTAAAVTPTTSSPAAVTPTTFEISAPNSNSMPRNYHRASTPASTFWTELEHNSGKVPPTVPPKPESTTQRMGIPEEEYHVPITVKPLKDAVVETVVLRVSSATPNGGAGKVQHTVWANKTAGVSTVTLNGHDAQAAATATTVAAAGKSNNVTTTKTVVAARVNIAPAYNNATLPRAGSAANRFTAPAVAAPPTPTVRASAGTLERQAKRATTGSVNATNAAIATAEPVAAPFGQNTLRKTGLKEKILAKEEADQQKVGVSAAIVSSQQQPAASPAKTTNAALTNGIAGTTKITIGTNISNNYNKKPAVAAKTTTLQSAKLELKLQQPQHYNGNSDSALQHNRPAATQHTSSPLQQAPPTTIFKTATTAPPPPPAPPMTLGINATAATSVSGKGASAGGGTLKRVSKSAGTTPTSPLDTRDQLMAAIRNFKRDDLNRA